MENRKVLLSVDNLHVNFKVRGRTLSAIRGISLDFYENESVAIVGESGSGKSVFTKTFAGMLETNGYISEGSVIFNDEELSDTVVKLGTYSRKMIEDDHKTLNKYSQLEFGAEVYKAMLELAGSDTQTAELVHMITVKLNTRQTVFRSSILRILPERRWRTFLLERALHQSAR